MKPDDDFDTLLDALRNDWPSQQQAARVRARLVAAGIAAGATLTASGAAAAGKAASSAGFVADTVARFAALSWGAKVGVAAVATVSAVATPVWLAQRSEPRAQAQAPAARVRESRPAPPIADRSARTSAHVELAPAAEIAEPAVPPPAPRAPAIRTRVQPIAAKPTPAPAARSEPGPSAAFEAAAAAPTTLGEETALLDAALAALRAGDRSTAERRLDEHQRRFANGLLRQERERARATLIDIDRTRENKP